MSTHFLSTAKFVIQRSNILRVLIILTAFCLFIMNRYNQVPAARHQHSIGSGITDIPRGKLEIAK